MSRSILVLQHHPLEHPGQLTELLQGRGWVLETCRLYADDALPVSPQGYRAVIVMGGPMSVHDVAIYPWLRAEKRFLAQALEQDLPLLGHCLGGQLLAELLGGEVYPNPKGQEIGWWPVAQAPAAQAWWPDLPATPVLFHWHGEIFTLPPGATLLLHNEHTPVQAFAHGPRVWAFQAHPEVTQEMVEAWIADFPQPPGLHPQAQTAAAMGALSAHATHAMAEVLPRLYGPWMDQIEVG